MITGLLIGLMRVYQKVVSPWLPRCCRFSPSCSNYAIEAIQTHGVVKGVLLAAWRVARCQPFCRGGYDPVPVKKYISSSEDEKRIKL